MGLQSSPGATPTTRTHAAATRDCRATAGRSGRRATPAASLACEAFGASVVVRRVDSMWAASLVADSVASPCRTTAAGMEGVEEAVLRQAAPLLTGNAEADRDIIKFIQARNELKRSK